MGVPSGIYIKIVLNSISCCVQEQKMTSNVVKTVGLSSKGSTRKRKHSLSDEEDSKTSHLHSIVKVKERK